MSKCMIPANPDISGIGVRAAIYAQNILSFAPAFYALVDGKVDSKELKTIEEQSTTILVTAFAILISTIVQALSPYGLSDFHTSVILNLSWMNNTNTFIYFILYVHHRSGRSGDGRILPRWSAWWEHVKQGLPIKPGSASTLHKDDLEMDRLLSEDTNHPEITLLPDDESSPPRAVSKIVIALGSLHLTVMAVVGFWLWISPSRFETSQRGLAGPPYPLTCTSVSLLGQNIRLSSPTLRAWSLVIYSIFLVPALNLLLPASLFLALYIYLYRRHSLRARDQRKAGSLPVLLGLFFLLLVNVVFMVDTELTIRRGKQQQQPGESQWTFGQTLALLLLCLPIRDTALLESYRRDSIRRITSEFLRGIERGDVDTIARLVGRQEVDVNVEATTGDFVSALQLAAHAGDMSLVQQLLNRNALVEKTGGRHGSALGAACFSGHEYVARLLLQKGARHHVKIADSNGETPLHKSAYNGRGSFVKLLLEHGADLDVTDQRGWTPLHVAASSGYASVVQALLQHGADPNVADRGGWTPLHSASVSGALLVAQILLEHGADPKMADGDGWTPLHRAVASGAAPVVRLLIQHGANIRIVDGDGWTPLHRAAVGGDVAVVELLLKRSADPNMIDGDGWTPLHRAAVNGTVPVVQLLLDNGASINVADRDGYTPLHRAAKGDNGPVVQVMLKSLYGADLKMAAHNGWTSLHLAAQSGFVQVVHILLQHGADLTVSDIHGETPLHLAVCEGAGLVVQLLLKHGASPEAVNSNNQTPLQIASCRGFKDVLSPLLEHGADPQHVDDSGLTPLHMAAYGGHYPVVQALLEYGADINTAVYNEGTTPLHAAALNGSRLVVESLLEHGANVRMLNGNGRTPLHMAAWNGHHSAVQVLLEYGANLTWVDDCGDTPLHLAAWYGHGVVVQLLLERGADLKVADQDGDTPLHLAASNGHRATIQILLERGADSEATNNDGKTARDVADESGFIGLAEALERTA